MSDKKTLLLEIGTEEIPAHAMPGLLEQLKTLATAAFKDARISVDAIKTLGTPRRLALLLDGVAARQSDISEERRGPSAKIAFDAEGKPSKAAIGFARGQKVDPSTLITRDGYVYAVVHSIGRPTEELLKSLLPKLITSINCPNNMRWGALEFKFIRPIRWLVALLDDEIIPFELAEIRSGRTSRGHRFLSGGEFEIKTASEYVADCERNFVTVDPERRKSMIRAEIEAQAKAHDGKAEITDDLLEEVLYLVEYPTALTGEFETKYLKLPSEAVITPMRDHQRYFPVKDFEGKLLPLFITVSNGGREHLDIVRHGNERVLKARLEDAQFFFNEDRKKSLEQHREKLKTVVFQEGLGSVFEKTERLEKLSAKIADMLGVSAEDRSNAIRAAQLSKADLVTGMVTEFTELQGVMGREYALLDGEPEAVAIAIDEHYMPRFAGDAQPGSAAGRILSLADKIDNLVATFSRGLIPTGSQDPFALRRQALGIVNMLNEAHQSLSIGEIVDSAMDLLGINDDAAREKMQSDIAEFMTLRIKNVLANDVRYDVLDAVLEDVDDPYSVTLRAHAVENFLQTPDAVRIVQSFVRAGNIAKKSMAMSIDEKLLQEEAEVVLCKAFNAIKVVASELIAKRDFGGALEALRKLAQPIDAFFDSVMVMAEDERIRANRLGMLKSIDELIKGVADFGKIVL